MDEDEIQAALATLLLETAERLEEMESGLLDLESGGDTADAVNSVFRAAHTIKGAAGVFGLAHIVSFTHAVETVLDQVRDGSVPMTSDLVSALLPCKDHIGDLMASVAAGADEPSPVQVETGEALLALLGRLGAAAPESGDVVPRTTAATDATGPRTLLLSLRFGPDTLRCGTDPLGFLGDLADLGEVTGVVTLDALLPSGAGFDPETSYLAFLVTLRTDRAVEEVEEVFEFVHFESDIRVLPVEGGPDALTDLVRSFETHEHLVRDALGDLGVGPAPDPDAAAPDAPAPVATAPDGPVPGGVTAPGAPAGAATAGPSTGLADAVEARTIRVDAARLDRLIDTVGELVIAGAGAGLESLGGDESLRAAVAEVTRLIEDVRADALRLRMVPIGATLGRFQRVVRDVGAGLGKEVSLSITGGETEVDKALVEHVADPLMHLVRNALDHGLESPDEREARGKPRRGHLELRARHDSGSIVIEVVDDGAGIDTAAVLAKAVDRGLVEPGAALSEREIHALVFEPGFSTAASVSALSGRGVGMDVVKRNVSALRGTIDVESRAGAGTTIRIRLPLTLAIIDGFMVGVGPTSFVVPLSQVLECVALPPSGEPRDYTDLRGEVLPLIRLRQLLGIGGQPPTRQNVVVVEAAGTKAGLVVDVLRGEFQTVIKPLGSLFADVPGIGGSTILGDGSVALIVDVPALVHHAISRTTHLSSALVD